VFELGIDSTKLKPAEPREGRKSRGIVALNLRFPPVVVVVVVII